MIRLHILGAGGAVPTATHGPAAYWIEVDGHGVLVDPGPGALVRLVRQPGAPDDVDTVETVIFSHLHLDHTADLAPLLFALHSVLARHTAPLTLVGPPGLAGLMARLTDVYGDWLRPRCRELVVTEVVAGGSVVLPGGGEAAALAADHDESRFGGACLGWRFTDAEGRALVYSGDTGPSADIERAAAGCDALLVECSTPDDLAVDGHLSPGRVADLAGRARPRRVILTHLYPPVVALDPAGAVQRATGIPCHMASDGDVITLGPEPEIPC
jgi:ribonuclease BN (tRNA processing enzyme)